ncbi:MAG: hypothetical protein DRG35_05570 [Deltaproteobacteria bacterium]|nr:MAG: hypothetical protein DRG35_05570 [Deltaproteobacteria bacterium]
MKPMVLYMADSNVIVGSEDGWGKHPSDLRGNLKGCRTCVPGSMLMAWGRLPRPSSNTEQGTKGGRQYATVCTEQEQEIKTVRGSIPWTGMAE